jgi:hypothetical protein
MALRSSHPTLRGDPDNESRPLTALSNTSRVGTPPLVGNNPLAVNLRSNPSVILLSTDQSMLLAATECDNHNLQRPVSQALLHLALTLTELDNLMRCREVSDDENYF